MRTTYQIGRHGRTHLPEDQINNLRRSHIVRHVWHGSKNNESQKYWMSSQTESVSRIWTEFPNVLRIFDTEQFVSWRQIIFNPFSSSASSVDTMSNETKIRRNLDKFGTRPLRAHYVASDRAVRRKLNERHKDLRDVGKSWNERTRTHDALRTLDERCRDNVGNWW